MAVSAAFTVVPFFIFDHLGGDARMSGMVSAVQAVFYAATCLTTARFVGGARNSKILGLIGALAFTVFVPLSILFRQPILFGALNVLGLSISALFWSWAQAWLGTEPDVRLRARRIAHYNIAWSMGLALSPLLAGPLYGVHYSLPFIAVAVFGAFACYLVATLPNEMATSKESADAPLPSQLPARGKSEAHLYATWGANLMGWLLVGVMRSVFPKRIDELVHTGGLVVLSGALPWEHLHASPATQYSWLLLVLYVSRAGLSWLLSAWHGWEHRFGLLVACQVAAAASFFVLGVTSSLMVMAICCLIVGINGGLGFFASQCYSVADPSKRQRRAAIHEGMVGVGSAIGSIAFGELAGRFGTTWPFRYTPVLVVAAIAIQSGLLWCGLKRQRLNR